ncbi:type II restriction endonuclease [Campylobacter pinnipediorum]|nr:type II restriction endonuclease [Campylobacter pinnipediorum]AQW82916.1 type II restriction endonuclease [Campylobacter pinnipediorum subsp. pinnipediorum]
MQELDNYIYLNKQDQDNYYGFLKTVRKGIIKTPKDNIDIVTNKFNNDIAQLLKNKEFTKAIFLIREETYKEFLKQEHEFNTYVLKSLAIKFDIPKIKMDAISDELYSISKKGKYDFKTELINKFGDYASLISPYIYILSLSNTQSRRSRAGKTFEYTIYYIYEYLGYPYNAQSQIGKNAFSNMGLGKIVDSILPSADAFSEFRNQCIIGSMKTTLRERWQEVVEEINRSNLPNIYLLTTDNNISENQIKQMREHNIILVVNKEVKDTFLNYRNVISFETYLTTNIPQVLKYWEDQNEH